MNSGDLATFNQGVALAQSGQKEAAYRQLKSLLNNNSGEANLWLWVAFTSSTLEESEAAIATAASLDPLNSSLAAAKEWLAGEQRKQPVTHTYVTQKVSGVTVTTRYSNVETFAPPSATATKLAPGQTQEAVEATPLTEVPLTFTRQMRSILREAGPVTDAPARRKLPRTLLLVGLVFLIVAALGAVVYIQLGRQNAAGTGATATSPYKLYTDPATVLQEAKIGDAIQFTATLEYGYKYEDKGLYYNWLIPQSDPPKGVTIKFPKEASFTPATGPATYYVRVVGRSDDNRYVYSVVENIKQ